MLFKTVFWIIFWEDHVMYFVYGHLLPATPIITLSPSLHHPPLPPYCPFHLISFLSSLSPASVTQLVLKCCLPYHVVFLPGVALFKENELCLSQQLSITTSFSASSGHLGSHYGCFQTLAVEGRSENWTLFSPYLHLSLQVLKSIYNHIYWSELGRE